jgi:hypothetical protein
VLILVEQIRSQFSLVAISQHFRREFLGFEEVVGIIAIFGPVSFNFDSITS